MTIKYGRATIEYTKGRGGDPCVNCGTIHATMYNLGLAKDTGSPPNISWRLCVDCRSHLSGVFRREDDIHKNIY